MFNECIISDNIIFVTSNREGIEETNSNSKTIADSAVPFFMEGSFASIDVSFFFFFLTFT